MNAWQWWFGAAILIFAGSTYGWLGWILWKRDKRERDQFEAEHASSVHEQRFIDTLINEVLSSQEGANKWLDDKKLIIAKVFADGEAWVNVEGQIVDKDDESAVAKYTFNVIRSAMAKFYTEGIKSKEQ